MEEVKTQRSRSYREYLISSLKDPERAAGYIEVMLELDEEGFEPELLRSALKEVVEAREQMNNLSEEAKLHYEKLDKILLETGGTEIHSLVEFMNALGFRIAIASKAEEIPDDKKLYSLEILFDATQVNLEELKDKAEKALQNYLTDINLKVEPTHPGYLQLAIKGTLEVIDACHNKINEILLNQSQLNFVRLLDEAGDEIRQRSYPILAEIEQRFRVFVNQALVEVDGFDWWVNFVPADIRGSVKTVQEQADGTFLNFLECTQFDHLIKIVTENNSEWSENKSVLLSDIKELLSSSQSIEDARTKFAEKTNKFSFWDNVFARYFQDRRQWEQIKKSIKEIVITERHKVMHHRPISLSAITKLLDSKSKLFALLDAAKSKLSEQERIEVRQDIEDNIEDIRDTISAQIKALIEPSRRQQSQLEQIIEPLRRQQQGQQSQLEQIIEPLRRQQQRQQSQLEQIIEPLRRQQQRQQSQLEQIIEPLRRQQQRQQSQLEQFIEPLRQEQSQLEQLRKLAEPWTQQNPNLSKPKAQTSETNLEQVTDQETDVNSDTDDSDENS